MLKTKRKFKRFDLPLGLKFKPTYGAKDYFTGIATNLSSAGLGLTADDFKFIMYEYLELIIRLPGGEGHVSLFGDILWKKQNGKRCSAGIKFRMKDKVMQENALKNIFSYTSIPAQDIYSNDPDFHMDTQKILFKPLRLPDKLGFIKQYNEDRSKCKITFRLLRETAKNSQTVTIVGDFNNWEISKSPMTRLQNGDFVITLDLDCGRSYRFRYLMDSHHWENDLYADRFVKNDHGSKDSVVFV